MATNDFLNVLKEIRGTEAPGDAYTDGIYHDISIKDYNGNPGMYGDILFMYGQVEPLVGSADALLNIGNDLVGKDINGNIYYPVEGSRILALGADLANPSGIVQEVVPYLGDIEIVAADIDSVVVVAGQIDKVITNHDNITKIQIVGGDLQKQWSHITDYGSIDESVTDVTGESKITTVADNIDDVIAVAGDIAGVSSVATNIVAVLDSENNAAEALASAQASEVSRLAAEAAKDLALDALDSFDDRYLGEYAAPPTLDNDGDPLRTGAIYYDISSAEPLDYTFKVWNGTAWGASSVSPEGLLVASANLSDVVDAVEARQNLGVEIGVDIAAYDATLEIGATADQTGAEIQSLYEAQTNKTLDSVDSMQFNGGVDTQGTITWNVDEETLDVILNGATLQLGQETHIHCRNNTGSAIANGTVVMATGTLGASGRITIAPYDGTSPVKFILGLTTVDMPNDSDGKVTSFGKVRGLDTSAWSEGDILYAAGSGLLTNVEPVSGVNAAMAIVISIHAVNGTVMVRFTPLDGNEFQQADADIVIDANYVHTDNNFTTAEKNAIIASTDITEHITVTQSIDLDDLLTRDMGSI